MQMLTENEYSPIYTRHAFDTLTFFSPRHYTLLAESVGPTLNDHPPISEFQAKMHFFEPMNDLFNYSSSATVQGSVLQIKKDRESSGGVLV